MIRSEATQERTRASHITYGSGNLELNLALQPRAIGSRLEVDGALVDRQAGGMCGVPAYLLRGNRILDEAATDERGTFRMRSGLKEGLRICLLVGDRMVELELDHQRSGRQESWGVRPTSRSV